MRFDPGIAVEPQPSSLGFCYGPGVFGPEVEQRRLDDLRLSLLDPNCTGPDPVYAIAMDVGKTCHRKSLHKHHLLFGTVIFRPGQLGNELVRSQGHVHSVSARCGASTPELVEIWSGRALVYLQEYVADDPGRCMAILAHEGEIVVIPPAWGHFVVNANPAEFLVFGAWCTRSYGFEYAGVRARQGLAWYPVVHGHTVCWQANKLYRPGVLNLYRARHYPELNLNGLRPIYSEFEQSPESLGWISSESLPSEFWERVVNSFRHPLEPGRIAYLSDS